MDTDPRRVSPGSLERLRRLVAALGAVLSRRPDEAQPEIVETHISMVLLTSTFAYKFKKPVDFGFADFSTLEKRRHSCEEEIRLNRRLLPEWYLDVAAIGGTPEAPRLDGSPPIEFAVRMRRFPRDAPLEQAVEEGRAGLAAFAELGAAIAAFHERAAVADPEAQFGRADLVARHCNDNLEMLRRTIPGKEPALQQSLERLGRWMREELRVREPLIEHRRAHGRVRECHGDMHLTNMLWLDGSIRLFDCIEFNAELRFIDVINEAAFLVMDLELRGRGDLARVFLNDYLQESGDYEGLALLRLFAAYRSLVRAKVASLTLAEAASADARAARERMRRHVDLALHYAARAPAPALVITHGLSGSGKSHVAARLIAPSRGALRLRSDVERKRLHGLAASARSGSGLDQGLYSAEATSKTYRRLLRLARQVLQAGYPAIVDATFQSRALRREFRELAEWMGCPFHILECSAPPDLLRRRVAERARQGRDSSDADLDVLAQQQQRVEALSFDERAFTVTIDTTRDVDAALLAARLEIGT